MARTEGTVTGPAPMPNGETPERGYIVFELTSWGEEDGETIIPSAVPTVIDVDTQDFSQVLWANGQSSRTVNYKVTAVWYYANKDKNVQLTLGYLTVEDSGTYQLGDILVGEEVTPTPVDVLAAAIAAAASASASADAAELAADKLVYTYDDFATMETDITSGGDGTVHNDRAEGFSYIEDSGSTFTVDGVGLTPDGYIRPPEMVGAAANGSTDDSEEVTLLASLSNIVDMSRKAYKVTEPAILPASVYIEGHGGSRYANPNGQIGGRIMSAISENGAAVYREGTTLQSQGAGVSGLSIGGHNDVSTDDFSANSIRGIEFHDVFNEIVENLTVDHINATDAIYTSGQCNKVSFINPRVCIVGTYSKSIVSASDYGNGINLQSSPDSEIINPFIEGLGGTGAILTSSCSIHGGFTDLCSLGAFATGNGPTIAGTSSKFHNNQAVSTASSLNMKITGGTFVSGNRIRNGSSTTKAAQIAMSGDVSGLAVAGNDFRHRQQWRGPTLPPVIHLGSNDGSYAEMRGSLFGDVISGGSHITDPNGLWADGLFTLSDFSLTMGKSRENLTTPVAFTDGIEVTSEFFTVTYGGGTYVANGFGHSFPWTTTSTFEYDSEYDVASDGTNDWVLLDEPSTSGMQVPANVISDVGRSSVSGTGTQRAMTLGTGASISGSIQVRDCDSFMYGGSGAIGPKFISNVEPTDIVVSTSPSSSASIRGWSFPKTVSHTGSGINESVDLTTLPARASGRMTVSCGFSGAAAFVLSADILWDGTTLTVSNRVIDAGVFGSTATFIDNSGELALQWSSGSAKSDTAVLNFDGIWSVDT